MLSSKDGRSLKNQLHMIVLKTPIEIPGGNDIIITKTISRSDKQPQQIPIIKITPKRYSILFLFVILAAIKGFQWICMSSITNVVSKYYGVSNLAVNWTTMLFMVTYLILALPVTALIEFIGLRRSVIIGGAGLLLGLTTKCFSVNPNGYLINFIGHLLIGLSEPFFFAVYSKLASIWFPDHEVGLATSIGLVADVVGVAFGFIIPVEMVGNDIDDIARIEWGLNNLYLFMAILAAVDLLLIIIFFDDQPKFPPGIARSKKLLEERRCSQEQSSWMRLKIFFDSTKSFFSHVNFNLMLTACGVNVGYAYAHHTLLNQMITENHEGVAFTNPISVTGKCGLILLVSGIFGSITFGILLDKFHAYKSMNVVTYLLCLVSFAGFTICLSSKSSDELQLYLATVPVGFFTMGYECCAIEYAVEVTYPKSELISSTLLIVSSQVFGLIITFIGSVIIDEYGSVIGCMFIELIMFIGFVSICFTTPEYKRQKAVESGKRENA